MLWAAAALVSTRAIGRRGDPQLAKRLMQGAKVRYARDRYFLGQVELPPLGLDSEAHAIVACGAIFAEPSDRGVVGLLGIRAAELHELHERGDAALAVVS